MVELAANRDECSACSKDLADQSVVWIEEDGYCPDPLCWSLSLEPSEEVPIEVAPNEDSGVDLTFGSFIDIRLTDAGRKMLESSHAKLSMIGVVEDEYVPPLEDEAGFSRWSLMKFMSTFGPHLYIGAPKLFENDAIIYPVWRD